MDDLNRKRVEGNDYPAVFSRKRAIHELSHGLELSKQLLAHLLNSPSQPLSPKLLEENLRKIIRSISAVLASAGNSGEVSSANCGNQATGGSYPVRFEGGGNLDFVGGRDGKRTCKRRKVSCKRTMKVLADNPESPHAAPTDDGYAWRKYGQKDILNANHPRSYFRCTHKNDQGCAALKQVQRMDSNQSFFEVTYIGYHTCRQFMATPPLSLDSTPSRPFFFNFESNSAIESTDYEDNPNSPFSLSSFTTIVRNEERETNHGDIFRHDRVGFASESSEVGETLQTMESEGTEEVSGINSSSNFPTFDNFSADIDSVLPFESPFLWSTQEWFANN
ncbi:hypothetical protein AMTRI_Chr08g168220 [Amborella trichopoda]|uniref:WRKY domain-containing protein n=1 Tax=Amborella trichopoda TaxID=13333 RepID=W1PB05_AMBTC|nr:probable WRKY transcription factor 46 [Amborella trichopoda]ERN04180.1 hypothetical protein AMTR_s00077p00103580 [Amborella trichopoda]|eukprot:XP_006842505.1 probable WRKY transcription factor 46 [Amborella trichopoda]